MQKNLGKKKQFEQKNFLKTYKFSTKNSTNFSNHPNKIILCDTATYGQTKTRHINSVFFLRIEMH